MALFFAITSLNAFIFNHRLNELTWLFSASLAAGLLAKGWRGNAGKRNYLQNGDGMVTALGIIASLVLFPAGGAIIAGIFCLGALILFRAFLLVTDIASFSGLFTNFSALVACGYLIHRYDISSASLQIIATGAFRQMISSQWSAAAAFLLMSVLYVLAIQLRHEIALFALGRDYFEDTGYRYRPALLVLELTRCMLTAAVVLGSGVFAAAGMVFISLNKQDTIANDATALARIALAVQILATLQAVSSGATAAIAAVCATILGLYIRGRFLECYK